ncbi:DUF6197 family protein [Streptomyces sp. NRRL F-5135]|uniref:DUF6197 family protein n=1 Tax=Streptomyces sp. NRRL F-5135 TaxID=1463858 RepID=UPI0004CC8C8D|nr:hypothetical protein [Streptomyces sp. NRRL F-5135]
MSSTGTILRTAAQLLNYYGLHTGDHFATHTGQLDLNAAIFRAVTGKTPNAFLTDDDRALLLITTNEPAMDAIRMLSAVLPTEPPTDPITGLDDHIDHLSWWPSYAPAPDRGWPAPTVSEVIGALHRAAQTADTLTDLPPVRTAA